LEGPDKIGDKVRIPCSARAAVRGCDAAAPLKSAL
jgi:hypothetical protein